MVFKDMYCSADTDIYTPAKKRLEQDPPVPRSPQEGDLIALVQDHIERLDRVTPEQLSVNMEYGRALVRYPLNGRAFDVYVGLPFTKGVTERRTGRTELLLATAEHHITAMQGQFRGADAERKRYGDTVRWINVGDTRNGFIGLDYKPGAKATAGVATSREDVQFLAQTLMALGYDPAKRLFLLEPPLIRESAAGKRERDAGRQTLFDWSRPA